MCVCVCERAAESDLKKLDSRIQKCTTLTKKLKQINESVREKEREISLAPTRARMRSLTRVLT